MSALFTSKKLLARQTAVKKNTFRVYNGRRHFVELMAGFEPATTTF